MACIGASAEKGRFDFSKFLKSVTDEAMGDVGLEGNMTAGGA